MQGIVDILPLVRNEVGEVVAFSRIASGSRRAAIGLLKQGTGSEPACEDAAKDAGCEAPVPLLNRLLSRRERDYVAV
jgi:hypothetical protein